MIDKIIKTLQTFIPFIALYPLWVKILVVFWILLTAIILIILIFVPKNVPLKKAGETKDQNIAQTDVANDVSTKANSLSRAIRTSVLNDLKYSIPLCEGIQKNIMEKDFTPDVDIFRSIYSPNVSLPSTDQTGVLHPEGLSALDEYRRGLTECAKHRNTYLRKLENKSYDNIESHLLIYCIGLDAVIRKGMNLVELLDKRHPDVDGPVTALPKYTIIDEILDNLTKAMQEAIKERGKKTKGEQSTPGDAG